MGSRETIARFDGAEAWATLTAEQQGVIGVLALELVAAWAAQTDGDSPALAYTPTVRAAEAAESALVATLSNTATAFGVMPPTPAVPSLLGRVCCSCGCSEFDACGFGCSWVEGGTATVLRDINSGVELAAIVDPDLCSACAPARTVANA